jgi:hypothetical protein
MAGNCKGGVLLSSDIKEIDGALVEVFVWSTDKADVLKVTCEILCVFDDWGIGAD